MSTITSNPARADADRFELEGRHGRLVGGIFRSGSETGLYFAHATGFCKEVWQPVTSSVHEAIPEADIIAWDSAAHGESEAGRPPYDWWSFGSDVLSVIDAFQHTRRIGIGHSMGAAALAMAEIDRPGTFDRLVLIEPITFPPPFGRFDNPLVDAALRRRNTFASPDAARRNFSSKEVFERWDKRALSAYVSGGLHHDDGEWVLRCDPVHEADIYRSGSAHGAYARLGEIEPPVLLLAGEHSTTHSRPVVDHLRARFQNASATIVPASGHFLPMEQPAGVAELIVRFIRGDEGA